jgi:hypothetical protein
MKKAVQVAAVVYAAFPWVWIGGLLCLAVRARFFLGYWPSPAHPDPKQLPFELHHMALWLLLFVVVVLLPTGLGVLAIAVGILKRKPCFWPIWANLGGSAIIGSMFFLPHGRLNWVAWFLD